MRTLLIGLLLQALTAPDPAQMEKAPDLGYMPVAAALSLPASVKMGAPSSVAMTRQGHLLVFNRGEHPLIELDDAGKFVRSFGEGQYDRPHGMRIDAEGNIWTTDVNANTVRKMNARGDVLLTLKAEQPNDIGFGRGGEVYVVQGHGMSEPRVLKYDKSGALLTSWGGKGAGPGQFDIAHSIVVDAKGLVYVADRQNRRVQIFDADGKYVKEWKYLGLPCGLYVDGRGQMYLVTGFAGQILRLDANGKATGATGQAGKGLGEFGEAHYLTIGPRDDIYVADTVNAQLHKFVKRQS
jgi:DNA-binding beta-propeller fold protein YncE